MPEQPQAIIYDAVRTPRGKGKSSGSLHEVKPIDLTVGLLQAIRERNPGLDAAQVDDLVMGIVSPVGDQGAVLPRIAALKAGYPEPVAGVQLNRFCGSGLEAVNQVAARVRSGFEDLLIAGGVESMSRVPMGSDGGAWAMDPRTALETDFVPQGISADLIATIEGYDRAEVDRFAAQSHARAAAAWEGGYFDKSVIPVKDASGITILDRDETIRPGTTAESLGGLRPSFAEMGELCGFDFVATEKYPHVTYFMNGGEEEPFPGEDRVMVPSPKVATYDLQPEMSAPELTEKAVAAIERLSASPRTSAVAA